MMNMTPVRIGWIIAFRAALGFAFWLYCLSVLTDIPPQRLRLDNRFTLTLSLPNHVYA